MDPALVLRARSGDHDAFTALATGAFDRLHRTARLILRDWDGGNPTLVADADQLGADGVELGTCAPDGRHLLYQTHEEQESTCRGFASLVALC